MTVGACQQMIKGVSGRCHSFSCITNRLFPYSCLSYAIQFKNGKWKKEKNGNERQKSVYIEGDTASVDWSGLWFVGLFYGFLFFFFSNLFRQGVQTIAVCFGRDGITNVYFLPNHILTKTIPSFCRIFSHGLFVRLEVSKDGNFLSVAT